MYRLLICLLIAAPMFSATKLRMHSAASGVSTYKEANPNLGTGLTTSVTNSAASGTQIQWTATAGGAVLSWISPPLAAGFTATGTMTFNTWASESNGQCNCGERVVVKRYTSGAEGATVASSARGTELTTNITNQNWTTTPTNTAFSAGDRIVVYWYLANVGTMGGSRTATADYNGAVNASNGETYVQFNETVNFLYTGEMADTALSAESVARIGGLLRTVADGTLSETAARVFNGSRSSADLTVAVVTATGVPSQHLLTRNAVDTAFVSEAAAKRVGYVRAASVTTLSAESVSNGGQGLVVRIKEVIGTGTNWPSLSSGAWAALSDSDWATLSSGLDAGINGNGPLSLQRDVSDVAFSAVVIDVQEPSSGTPVGLTVSALPAGSEESVNVIVKNGFLPVSGVTRRPSSKPFPVGR